MEYDEKGFESEIPDEALKLLYDLGKPLELDPLGSEESKRYFARVVATYTGEKKGLADYLREVIRRTFPLLGKPPCWIQGSEWQFYDGRPMTFVGQLDTENCISFYLFWDEPSGETKTVVQYD